MYANFITPFITEDPAEENPSTPALASREELYPLEYQSFLTNLRQQRQQIISAGPPVVVVTPTGTTVTDPLLMRASPEREDEDDSDVDDLRGLEDLFASPDASQAGGGDFEEYYSQSQNRERLEEEIRLNELAARSFATDETRRMRGLYSPNTPSWSPVGGATTTTTTTTTDAVITAAAKEIAREEKSRSETEEGGNRGLSAAINNWKRRYEGAPRNVFTSSPENDASISDPEDVPGEKRSRTATHVPSQARLPYRSPNHQRQNFHRHEVLLAAEKGKRGCQTAHATRPAQARARRNRSTTEQSRQRLGHLRTPRARATRRKRAGGAVQQKTPPGRPAQHAKLPQSERELQSLAHTR